MTRLVIFDHFPYSPNPGSLTIESLTARATPGEVVTASFSVRCGEDFDDLAFTASDLTGEDGTVATVEPYVVTPRTVAGLGLYRAEAVSVGKLLLKDDRAPIVDTYLEVESSICSPDQRSWRYQPPCLRLSGEARTALEQGETKQIFLSIKVKDQAIAGTYRGDVTISAPEGVLRSLSLHLRVLPFRLDEPWQDLMIWYKGSLDPANRHYLPVHLYRLQMEDIFLHGFRSFSIAEQNFDRAQQMIDIAESIGFNGNAVFYGHMPARFDKLSFTKLKPVLYASDELDNAVAFGPLEPSEAIADHRRRVSLARQAGWKSMASLIKSEFFSRLKSVDDINAVPDITSFFIPTNQEFMRFRSNFEELRKDRTYYYWQTHMEKPNLHRVLCGLYLFKSGCEGISPYCYQHLPVFPSSPYDDSQDWEPGFHVGGVRRVFRHHMTTYPAVGGVVSTLAWEGAREGITDLRYLITAEKNALKGMSQSDNVELNCAARSCKERIDRFLSSIRLNEIRVTDEKESEPYDHLDPESYHLFRVQLSSDLEALTQLNKERSHSIP